MKAGRTCTMRDVARGVKNNHLMGADIFQMNETIIGDSTSMATGAAIVVRLRVIGHYKARGPGENQPQGVQTHDR